MAPGRRDKGQLGNFPRNRIPLKLPKFSETSKVFPLLEKDMIYSCAGVSFLSVSEGFLRLAGRPWHARLKARIVRGQSRARREPVGKASWSDSLFLLPALRAWRGSLFRQVRRQPLVPRLMAETTTRSRFHDSRPVLKHETQFIQQLVQRVLIFLGKVVQDFGDPRIRIIWLSTATFRRRRSGKRRYCASAG